LKLLLPEGEGAEAWKTSNKATFYRKIRIIGRNGKNKGKAIPLQAWTGLEGSSKLRLPHFMTIGT